MTTETRSPAYLVSFSRPGLAVSSKITSRRTDVGYMAQQIGLDLCRMKGQRFPGTGGNLIVKDITSGRTLSCYRWDPETGTFCHAYGTTIGTIEALKPATTPPFSAYIQGPTGEYELAA
jgi:hypothetical protein